MAYTNDNPANIKGITDILNPDKVPEGVTSTNFEHEYINNIKSMEETITNPDVELFQDINQIIAQANNSKSAGLPPPDTIAAHTAIDPDQLIQGAFNGGQQPGLQSNLQPGLQPGLQPDILLGASSPDAPAYKLPAVGAVGGFANDLGRGTGDERSRAAGGINLATSMLPTAGAVSDFGGVGGTALPTSGMPQTISLNTNGVNSPNVSLHTTGIPKIAVEKQAAVQVPIDELLSEIDTYRKELEINEINIEGIPIPNERSSYEDILSIRNILRHKIDRIIAGSVGEVVLIEAAKLIGTIFNGERKIGPFRPYLAGWDATVRNKVNRHRTAVASIAQGALDKVGLSGDRGFFLELVMSGIAYSNMNSKKSNNQDRFDEAVQNLRGL